MYPRSSILRSAPAEPNTSTHPALLSGTPLSTLGNIIRKARPLHCVANLRPQLLVRGIGVALILVLWLLCAPLPGSAQTLPNLTGAWTGSRTEIGDTGLPPNSNQVLVLYQIGPGGPVLGTLSTYWPGTSYYWVASASGTISGNTLTLTWAIIAANTPNGGCGGTENLTLSVTGGVVTAAVPTYHPCGSSGTIEPYTLTLVGWQKMLGMDNSGGTGCACFSGDPIDVATGNVYESVKDYETAGSNKLSFIRYYNSFTPIATYAVSMGQNWRTHYDRYLNLASSTQIIAERPDGEQLPFNLVGTTWTPDSDVDMTLTNTGATWTLTLHDDTMETYTATASEGLIDSIRARDGYTQTMAYSAASQLTSVTDSYGRELTFSYTGGLLTQVDRKSVV